MLYGHAQSTNKRNVMEMGLQMSTKNGIFYVDLLVHKLQSNQVVLNLKQKCMQFFIDLHCWENGTFSKLLLPADCKWEIFQGS